MAHWFKFSDSTTTRSPSSPTKSPTNASAFFSINSASPRAASQDSKPSSAESSRNTSISPPQHDPKDTMQTSEPINIATNSRNSSSPQSQAQLQANNYRRDTDARTPVIMMGDTPYESTAGAQPISMRNPHRDSTRPRRESLAASLVDRMSWGGVSVGSWVRDELAMAGTSPFPQHKSPSFHSSSYLPKLEAEFLSGFGCCGRVLPSLHDLLQHYEESHAQQTPQTMRPASQAAQQRANQQPDAKAAVANLTAANVQQQAQQQQKPSGISSQIAQGAQGGSGLSMQMRQQQQQHQLQRSRQSTPATKQEPSDDMDAVEDMEMDDDTVGQMEIDNNTATPSRPQMQQAQQSMFGQQSRPQLHLPHLNGLQHQGLRTSQPTTPAQANFGFQNNPTVSSVNTPTLSTHQHFQQGNPMSADGSAPGTPAELDDQMGGLPMNMNINMNMGMMNLGGAGNFGYQDMNLDLCIDEPAKRLFSPNGGFNQRQLQQQLADFNLGVNGNQFNNMNNDFMRQFTRQQQLLAMQAGGGVGLMAEEHKPFRCPVVGCEKAYKNQNGLKYHKTHGHQTQQLHENGDGTFSIVNPDTSKPYPGTMGMEKEKPYKCDICGKRYKNLNGLKYHKQHSPPCNPDLKLNSQLQAAGLAGLAGLGGPNLPNLPNIGEDQIMM